MFLQFYGMREQPFGVTPDPRFLYMSDAHREVLASLLYGIETGRGFMALIAAPGLGKTTLLIKLLQTLRESALTAFLFQTQSDGQELIRSLIEDLGFEAEGHSFADLQRQFRTLLLRESEAGRRFVVVLDEAQNLGDSALETLRMLSNFESPQAKLMQIVLTGQPQLADKLQQTHLLQLRQRISILAHLPPLKPQEVKEFIHYRLRVAGYEGLPLFKREALDLIASHSGGVPRDINNICFHALSLGFAKDQKQIDSALLREALADLDLKSLGSTPQPAPSGPVKRRSEPSALFTGSIGANESGPLPTLGGPWAREPELERPRRWEYSRAVGPDEESGQALDRGRKRSNRWVWPVAVAVIELLILWKGVSRHELALIGQTISSAVLSKIEKPLPKPVPAGVSSPATPPPARSEPRAVNEPANGQPGGSVGEGGRAGVDAPETAEGAEADSDADQGDVTPADNEKRITQEVQPSSASVAGHTSGPTTALSSRASGEFGGGGKLTVESDVPGSLVSIDGRVDRRWVTPRSFSLAPGTHLVSVAKPGYSTWTRRVHVGAGEDKWIIASPADAAAAAMLIVQTDPAGLPVKIDGKAYGRSPVRVELPAGWHRYEVAAGPFANRSFAKEFKLESGVVVTKKVKWTFPRGASRPGRHVDVQEGSIKLEEDNLE